MPLQHYSPFPVYPDYNLLKYPQKFLPEVAIFDSDDQWNPRIKHEDYSFYQPQPALLYDTNAYYSPPFQNVPIAHLPRAYHNHQHPVPLSAAFVHPAEVSPSVDSVPPLSPYPDTLSSNTTTHTSWLDDDPSSLAVVSAMDVINDGSEQDAEGEDDWSHDSTNIISQYSHYQSSPLSDSDARRPSLTLITDHDLNTNDNLIPSPPQLLHSALPLSSEEEISSSNTSDEDFEDLTSEDDEHEDEEEEDDDDEYVLNSRPQRRSMSSIERRTSRTALASANAVSPSLIKPGPASDLASSGFVPYSLTEGRSLRSRSASGRYNPYPNNYPDYYPEQASFSGDLDSPNDDNTKLDMSPGRRRARPSGSLGVPVPVPNLTKKSRGRRVPTMSSLEDLRSAASGAGKKRQGTGGKSARMYLCDVEGCGKCFARGEHLKRHVRSIHTYEKPHKCPYPGCGKDFSRHDNLGQHMRVHKDFVPPSAIAMRRKSQQV